VLKSPFMRTSQHGVGRSTSICLNIDDFRPQRHFSSMHAALQSRAPPSQSIKLKEGFHSPLNSVLISPDTALSKWESRQCPSETFKPPPPDPTYHDDVPSASDSAIPLRDEVS
jgi:hypothetical protein